MRGWCWSCHKTMDVISQKAEAYCSDCEKKKDMWREKMTKKKGKEKVVLWQVAEVEKVKAYISESDEDELVELGSKIVDAYKCSCGELYRKADEAADCCGLWKRKNNASKE